MNGQSRSTDGESPMIRWTTQSREQLISSRQLFWAGFYVVVIVASTIYSFFNPPAAMIAAGFFLAGAGILIWNQLRSDFRVVRCVLDDGGAEAAYLNIDANPDAPAWATREGIHTSLEWVDLGMLAMGQFTDMGGYHGKHDEIEGEPVRIRWRDVESVRFDSDDQLIALRNGWRTVVKLPVPWGHQDDILDFIRTRVKPDVSVPGDPVDRGSTADPSSRRRARGTLRASDV